MSVDLTKLNFYSLANYMKRDAELCGSKTITLGSSGGTNTITITHNYGYIPFYEVYCNFTGGTVLWAGELINQYTETSISGGSYVYPPYLDSWVTTTTLTINLYDGTDPTQTGDRTVYYLIYKDYGNVS